MYKEYLKVEADFIPVFSSSMDRTHPDRWKTFYPHESFKKILTLAVETFEKGFEHKDRSIWISGGYGTGKTFASFVIKHIFEDEIAQVQTYFERYEMMSLWQRVLGVRSKGKILVVHQGSSSGINTKNKLFTTIIDSVKRALRRDGYRYVGGASLLEKILATLKDEDSTFNFRAVFKKYRGKFMEYSTPEEVITDLETLDGQDKLDLLEDLADVAEKESYNWSMGVEDVLNWLRDVREKNKLYAIFFIWDEFTEYFRNNLNNVTSLQELAQNSSELNFYFFLITHSDANQLITDSSQRKIIEARFKLAHITLAESTAFQLMSQAFTVVGDKKSEWERITRELWTRVERGAVEHIVRRDESITFDDLRKILPIHPYAAYLLKFIAQSVSSNQRTMFQFLCADDDGSFANFVASHGFEDGDNFLTADSLWDYFFREDNPDLDRDFQEVMSFYNNFVVSCNGDNQRRVLKAMLILFALQSKIFGGREGATSLLRLTRKNLCAIYAGTALEGELRQTLVRFAEKGLVSVLEESDDVYYMLSTTQIDRERLGKILAQVRAESTFDALIRTALNEPIKNFLPRDYMKYRLDVQVITPMKFLESGNANLALADNRIAVFYLFAADEFDQGQVNRVLRKIFERQSERCMVADFSGVPFTKYRYEKFVMNRARELYFAEMPNQTNQKKMAMRSWMELVTDWANQLNVAGVRVWSSPTESVQVAGSVNFLRLFKEINGEIFSGGMEVISTNDKLFQSAGFTSKVAEYALSGEVVKRGYVWLNFLGDELRNLVGHGAERYWQLNPSHVISRMKLIVERFIERNFDETGEVALSDIWDELKRPPIGLFKCAGAVYLFTALLREYADKNFYIRDGLNGTQALTGELLCELITDTVKETYQPREKILVRQTSEHMKFCWIVATVFELASGEIHSVDDALMSLRGKLEQVRYPLWLLKIFVAEKYGDSATGEVSRRFLELFEDFSRSQVGLEATKIADAVCGLYNRQPTVMDELKEIVRLENFRTGLLIHVMRYKSELLEMVAELNLTDAEYISVLEGKLSAKSWLWRVEEINLRVDEIFGELKLTVALNGILSERQKNFLEAAASLRGKLNKIRIPRGFVEEFYPQLKGLLQMLVDVVSGSAEDFVRAAELVTAEDAAEFNRFFAAQGETFSEAMTVYVDGTLRAETIEQLFNEAADGTFFTARDEFILQMKLRIKRLRQADKTEKFFSEWRAATGTNTPAEWSTRNEMPILCVFQDCLTEAQTYFDALNGKSDLPNEAALDGALQFIRSGKLKRLEDATLCTELFQKYFCGEDYSVVVDVENLRKILRLSVGSDVYTWFSRRTNCLGQIRSLADESYRQKYLPIVRQKIRALNSQEAQRYLEELINKDTLFGIRILKNT